MTTTDAGASPAWTPGRVPLDALLRALAPASAELVVPGPAPVEVATVALVDADDLADPATRPRGPAELWLLAGVPAADAAGWLAGRPAEGRPAAVLTKAAGRAPALVAAARAAGVALVGVHPQARWEQLLATARDLLERSLGGADSPLARGTAGVDTDLAGLAQTLSALTRGMVSIEDEHARVLAYSASDDAADELRRLSILGRAGPPRYLERLRAWGVYDRLRRSDAVVEVPADAELGLRRRLVVSMRETVAEVLPGRPPRPRLLGTIWVQEGAAALAPDAEAVLRGASAVAARLITRARDAPTHEAVQIQRLLGARGGGVDVPSLAASLGLPTGGPAVVVGFGAVGPAPAELLGERADALRLHASAFARESLVTTLGDRIYLLLPRAGTATAVAGWTSGVLGRLRSRPGAGLRAAVAAPVASLAEVPLARAEVDRVLDQTPAEEGVTTLADARTAVLLGEVLDLVAAEPALRDPRLDTLLAYDARHGSALRSSVEAHLRHFGDVRAAATELSVHPNTLRYRLRRAEQLLGMELADADTRLLVELQLAVLRRSPR
ncbi:PucR family transcriptional regulator [Friedmanniella luteola]|uniref:PucR family transcriptional regulator n=1 Tax=Friedmanniella luteola TaxID=546871 RepID=UPI0018D2D3E8|nr:helix-turn-helix domain-containing protein [Friedmanniella luteola]